MTIPSSTSQSACLECFGIIMSSFGPEIQLVNFENIIGIKPSENVNGINEIN